MNNTLRSFFIPLIILLLVGCGTKEKSVSESEKKLMQLAAETQSIINSIDEAEANYSQKKSTQDWKNEYKLKREEIQKLYDLLQSKIQEGRFMEQLPEEGLKPKAQLFLHAAENIKTYIMVTNADMTKIFRDSPPPAVDSYNHQRYLTPAMAELKSISGGSVTTTTVAKDNQNLPSANQRGRYMLNEQDPNETGKQIRAGANQANAWRDDANATQSALDAKAKEAEKKVRR
jgi:hypothetical protein